MKKRVLRILTGKVISDKMDKTITVLVTRTSRHSIYNRVEKRSKKYKAHDEENKAKTGDTVRITRSRPLSRTKRWRLIEVLK